MRSSLEEMLESLQRRDDDKPTDLPPALPSRPSSKARLPSSRKSLPVNFKVGDENGVGGLDGKDEILRSSRGSFGRRKKVKVEQPGKSPYAGMLGEKRRDEMWMNRSVSDLQAVASTRYHETEWEDDMEYFIKKKLNVWCRRSSGSWVSGRIQSTSGDKVLLLLPDGRVIKGLKGDLFPANPDILDGVDDIMQLNFLNEPSVVHNIQYRYSKESIYFKAGPLLISLNPFKDLHIYDNDAVTAYRQKIVDIPHVYATVDTAYSEMMRDGRNQSIVLSGESGGGKTETAKFAINYLTSLSGSNTGIERKIIQSNYILEAFGNAQTLRNDNASRYGKLTEIHFTSTGNISCSRVHTFFLEKSRVVQLTNGERSFHVFYQLCAGAPPSLKAILNLKAANFYKYLGRSDSTRIHNSDDEQSFDTLSEALDIIQICKEDQERVFAMVAAVLWLGNISFSVCNSGHVEVVADEALTTVSRLLGCGTQDLITALLTIVDSGNSPMIQQVMASRDAFASHIYASLFEWLVEEINKSFEVGKGRGGNTISILDMFGFETSMKNSFEQICINYANERLHQHYNRHLFAVVQEEQEMEGIDFSKVDFEDNQDCLTLFEKIPRGFFSLLDEESSSAKASDVTFASKLKQHLSGHSCKSMQGGKFTIHHYAGEVTYDTDGFLTKNKDSLHRNYIQLLASCSCSLPQLFSSRLLKQFESGNPSSPRMTESMDRDVGTLFKGQIFTIIQQLESSKPHFILCIRPNSKQLPGMFENELVSKQLRHHRILEVARMHRCGYPIRMTHQEFSSRFSILLGDTEIVSQDPFSTSTAILQLYRIHPTSYQVGYTKLFFRAEQIDQLEAIKNKVLEGMLEVRKLFQQPNSCLNFEATKIGVITLQSFIRGENARREYSFLRSLSPKELSSFRAFIGSQKIVQLQSASRGWLARQEFSHIQSAKRLSSEMATSVKVPGTETPRGLPQQNAVVSPSVMQDIRVQLVKAEATLGQKEEENTALRQQLQQLQSKWSGHEAKMKIMEDAWQQQMTSLQASLTAAKKSISADNPPEPRRFMVSPSPHSDSEDTMSMGNHTGAGSPMQYIGIHADGRAPRDNGKPAPIGHLVNEFDQRKQIFDEEARALDNMRLGQSGSNPEQQLRQLKLRFAQWKKDFKVRLRETKAKLRKQGNVDMERSHKKWWGKKHLKPS